jgi:hypothetical protein
MSKYPIGVTLRYRPAKQWLFYYAAALQNNGFFTTPPPCKTMAFSLRRLIRDLAVICFKKNLNFASIGTYKAYT